MRPVELIPIPSVDVIGVGEDLACHLDEALAAADVTLRDGDVVVVASKVVALAERAVATADGSSGRAADPRRELARAVADHVVADAPQALVVATHHGFVCANAGIDTSNVRDGLLLLPHDPDRSAGDLRRHLHRAHAADVAVVITDTFGRPWRVGQVDVAIGVAGIAALRDERGGPDLHGRTLHVTQVAVGDELAAAADLVRTKANRVPFVVVRGADASPDGDEHGGAAALVRAPGDDLFPAGGPTLWEHAVRTAAPGLARLDEADTALTPAPHDAGPVVARAMAVLGPAPGNGCRLAIEGGALLVRGDDAMAVGMVLQAVHTVLTGHGWRMRVLRCEDDEGAVTVTVRPLRAPGGHNRP